MNTLSWSRYLGVLTVLLSCALVPGRPHAYGSPEACPLGRCGAGHEPSDPPAPQVTMKVRVPATAHPGRELEYRVFLENTSAGAAHHVIVKCPLPANVKFVRASPAPHQQEPELQWHLGTMHGGGKCEVSLVVLPEGADDVKMCFRVQYEHGQCVTTRLVERPDTRLPGEPPLAPEGKRPPVIQPIPPVTADKDAKLDLKIEGPDERPANLPAKYFLSVANTGKTMATNLLLSAILPEKTEFVSATEQGVHLAGQVAWVLKELPVNQKWTVELVFKSQGPGRRCVRANVLADQKVSDQDEKCTDFIGLSALYIEMIDHEDPIALGGETSFPITVVNTGAAPATNLRIRALVPPQMVLAKTAPEQHQLGERIPEGQWLIFGPSALAAGGQATVEVFVKGVQTGDARFRIELSADQLERGPVTEVESTHIYEEDGKVPVRMLSRKRLLAR